MKKIFVLGTVIFLILIGSVLAATPLAMEGASLDKSIAAGGSFTFRLTFKNIGTTSLANINYEVFADSGITGYSSGLSEAGGLVPGASRSVDVNLIAASDATSGTHTVTIKARYSGGPEVQQSFPVEIGGTEILYVSEITITGDHLAPGKNAPVIIHVQNLGETAVYDVVGSLTFNKTTLKPYLGGGSAFASLINPNQDASFEFQISADNDADTQTYTSTLTLEYKDEDDISRTKEITLGIPVSGVPLLQVLNSEIEDGQLEVEVGNLGTSKAKAIRVELVQDGEIVDVDIDNELKADKHTTLRFNRFNRGAAELRFTYFDEDNIEYVDIIELVLDKSAGSGSSISMGTILLLLVAALEGYYIYKLRRPKK